MLTLDLVHFQCEPGLLTARSLAAAVWSLGKVSQFRDQVWSIQTHERQWKWLSSSLFYIRASSTQLQGHSTWAGSGVTKPSVIFLRNFLAGLGRPVTMLLLPQPLLRRCVHWPPCS